MADGPTIERIKQEVTDNEVMLFMKGTPVFPQCGFRVERIHVRRGAVHEQEDDPLRPRGTMRQK